MQSSRTIDSIITGVRGAAYISLSKAIMGIMHKPENNLKEAYTSIIRSPQFADKMSQMSIPGNPVYNAKLTEDEKAALLLYTFRTSEENLSFSNTLNKAMSSRSDVIRELRGFILHMLSGLRKLPQAPSNTPAYHVISAGHASLDFLGYVQGRTVVWSSFVSMTPVTDFIKTKTNSSHTVFEVSGRGAVMYDITPFVGTSEQQQVPEFLLEPDTTFKVQSIEQNCPMFNGATLIKLSSSDPSCIHPPILSTIIETFRGEGAKALSKSRGLSPSMNHSEMHFDSDKTKLPAIGSFFQSMPSTTYYSIRDAVISANFTQGKTKEEINKGAEELIGHCRETLSYLKEKGILSLYKMTEEQAIAIIIYTFDYGGEKSKLNPCYQLNKVLGKRNTNDFHKMRPFILHLLSGLRKLPRVDNKKPLYRGMNGANIQPVEKHYSVGMERGWTSFTSTCYDPDCAEDFTTGDFPVIFKITGDYVGYDITEFSIFNEPEVIIEPETAFVVKNVNMVGGTHYITIEVKKTELVISAIINQFESNSHTALNTNTVLPPQPKKKQQNVQESFNKQFQQQQMQQQQIIQQYQQQHQQQQIDPVKLGQDLSNLRMYHFSDLVTPILQNASQKYPSISDFVNAIYKGEIPLANDPVMFIKLADKFFKVYPQFTSNLATHFSNLTRDLVDWERKNFWSAYVALLKAINDRAYSETFMEFCLTPPQYVGDEKNVIEWVNYVQRQVSIRYPHGTLDVPRDTKKSIRKTTRSKIWFFMTINTKDPEELVRKVKSRPDIVNSCYFTARLYKPTHVKISFSSQEVLDPRSIFSRYNCANGGDHALCDALHKYLCIFDIVPLNITRMQSSNQNDLSFHLIISSPEDIPKLRTHFRSMYAYPVVNVEYTDDGAELLSVLLSSPKPPFSILTTTNKSFVITFIDDLSYQDFCSKYRQKYTILVDSKQIQQNGRSKSVPPMPLVPSTTTPPNGVYQSYIATPNATGQMWGNGTQVPRSNTPPLQWGNYQQPPPQSMNYQQHPPSPGMTCQQPPPQGFYPPQNFSQPPPQQGYTHYQSPPQQYQGQQGYTQPHQQYQQSYTQYQQQQYQQPSPQPSSQYYQGYQQQQYQQPYSQTPTQQYQSNQPQQTPYQSSNRQQPYVPPLPQIQGYQPQQQQQPYSQTSPRNNQGYQQNYPQYQQQQQPYQNH